MNIKPDPFKQTPEYKETGVKKEEKGDIKTAGAASGALTGEQNVGELRKRFEKGSASTIKPQPKVDTAKNTVLSPAKSKEGDKEAVKNTVLSPANLNEGDKEALEQLLDENTHIILIAALVSSEDRPENKIDKTKLTTNILNMKRYLKITSNPALTSKLIDTLIPIYENNSHTMPPGTFRKKFFPLKMTEFVKEAGLSKKEVTSEALEELLDEKALSALMFALQQCRDRSTNKINKAKLTSFILESTNLKIKSNTELTNKLIDTITNVYNSKYNELDRPIAFIFEHLLPKIQEFVKSNSLS